MLQVINGTHCQCNKTYILMKNKTTISLDLKKITKQDTHQAINTFKVCHVKNGEMQLTPNACCIL
jgi:hypothetical protein